MKKTKSSRTITESTEQIIKDVASLIEKIEQIRDFERDLSNDELQLLNIFYVVNDFIAKSNVLKSKNYGIYDFKFVDEFLNKLNEVKK